MKKYIKAFGVIHEFANNGFSSVAARGELSEISKTYSSNVRTFDDGAAVDVGQVKVFSAKQDDGAELSDTDLQNQSTELLDALSAVATFTDGDTGLNQLESTYTAPTYDNVDAGQDALMAGDQHIPSFITFEYTSGTDDYVVTIWFSNSAFESEYDEWEIRVIPPITPIDNMYGKTLAQMNSSVVPTFNLATQVNSVASVENGSPSTYTEVFNLLWQEEGTPNNTLPTQWVLVGYGPQASTYLNKLQALREYFEANSTYAVIEAEWLEHFPDLLTSNEFVVIPLYDRPAVQANGTLPSRMNPTIDPNSILDEIDTLYSGGGLDLNAIKGRTQISTMAYKGYAFLVIGGDTNTSGDETWLSAFPDYTTVGYANMSELAQPTQDAINAVEELIRNAETDTGSGSTPVPSQTRETIPGTSMQALVTSVNTLTMKVVTKLSYDNIYGN